MGAAIQVDVTVNGKAIPLGGQTPHRAFGSASLGYQTAGKVNIADADGTVRTYQAQVQFVEVGSKERVDEEAKALRAAQAAK